MHKILSKLRAIASLSIPKFIHYNYLCRKVHRDKGCYIVPYRHAIIELQDGAEITLHGNLYVNSSKLHGSRAESYLLLRENSSLTVKGPFSLHYNTTVELHSGSRLTLGSGYINCGSVIMVDNDTSIGNDVVIARNVYIFDSDYHKVIDDSGKQINTPRPLVIGDHVWIGVKSTLLRGTTVESGAVIAAGSTVKGTVKSNSLAKGFLAQDGGDIKWE